MRFDKDKEEEVLNKLLFRRDEHIVFPGEARADGNIIIGRDHLRIFMRRYLYKLFVNAELSRGEFLLSDCGVRDCQNPFHVVVSRIAGHIEDHCRNGHKYTGKDIGKNGNHLCRKCLAIRRARHRTAEPVMRDPDVCGRGHDLRIDGVYTSTDKAGHVHQTCRRCKLNKIREQRKTR
jgi:hypothetical protein